MFLKKFKPSSAGTRNKKIIVNFNLKQKKIQKLCIKYKNVSGRSHNGNILVRGKGHKHLKLGANVNYFVYFSKKLAIIAGIFRQKLNTVFLALLKYTTGAIMYTALLHGAKLGSYVFSLMYPANKSYFFSPGSHILLQFIDTKIIFSNLSLSLKCYAKYIRAAGTYTRIYQNYYDYNIISFRLPTGGLYYLTYDHFVIIGRNSNIFHIKQFRSTAGYNIKLGFKSKVRGVAMNPVDHPHGGRTKTSSPELSPWGWVAKKNK